jgi:hypothetical protein
MHLIESYAASSGLKIDKPFIKDIFFPLAEKKFITIDSSTSENGCMYNHWQDVVDTLAPYLQKNDISIIQLGSGDDRKLINVNRVAGLINLNQASYLIRHSLLHVGCDTTCNQIACSLDKKMITLLPSKTRRNLSPYWGDKNNQVFFYRKTVKPEDICENVLKFLGIKYKKEFETVFYGGKYTDGVEFIETVPNQAVVLSSLGVNNIMVRMDMEYNERYLIQQLTNGNCTIITNKPINLSIIKNYKKNIKELVYLIEKEDHPDFCKKILNEGIQLVLVSELKESEINEKKINYLDFGRILVKENKKPEDIPELEGIKLENLYYKSNKYTLSNGKIYLSESGCKNDVPVSSKNEICKIINESHFWNEIDSFYLLRKTG